MSTSDSQTNHKAQTNWRYLPRIGAALTIGLQILWPLTSATNRATLTMCVVITFAVTSTCHAWVHRGAAWAWRYAATTLLLAFGVEAIGVATGIPFGQYSYGTDLGPKLLDVPLIIPLAWEMTAYPALLISRRLTKKPLVTCALGAFALTTWDIFLDPQMVWANYWTWASPIPAVPGIPGIPVTNYLGWLVATALLMYLLGWLPRDLPNEHSAEGVPAVLWTWTWLGGIIGNALFFGRPAVAVWGGVLMAAVTVPYLVSLRRATTARAGRPVRKDAITA